MCCSVVSTVIREIFVVWAYHEYILSQNLFTHVEKMEDYERDLLCSWLLALLESPERLLELVVQTKVSLLGPVSHVYTAIEPFLPALNCSHDRISLIYMHTFICW